MNNGPHHIYMLLSVLSSFECGFFTSYTLKPFNHAKHDYHGKQANGCEHNPSNPDGELVVQQRTNPKEAVTHCGGTEPETLAETEKVLGSNLGDEAETQRTDEKLSNGHEEVVKNQHPCASLEASSSLDVEGLELGCRRIALHVAEDGHEKISNGCDTHTDGDFLGGGDTLATTVETLEEEHDGEGEHDDEEGVDSLPDFGSETFGVDEVASEE